LTFQVLKPDLQVDFYYRLESIRRLVLSDSLSSTVRSLDLSVLDDELSKYVNGNSLSVLASYSLRGEKFFPIPEILQATPSLLGYYRLLYGFSQKAFYAQGPFGRFRKMEEENEVTSSADAHISSLCESLVETGEQLLSGLPNVTVQLIHELQLLTLGPMLRGSKNNQIGSSATQRVLNLVAKVAEGYVVDQGTSHITVRNSSGRIVMAMFASDPDITIRDMTSDPPRPLVSVEIKGGGDVSNIHNRIGEAEKSHLKAKSDGYFQFWTILGAPADLTTAGTESPTTDKFFFLSGLEDKNSDEWDKFRSDVAHEFGIPYE